MPDLTPQDLIHLGQEEIQKGNLRKAQFALQYALKKAKQNGVQSCQASALLNMAVVYITAEKPNQAIDSLNTLTNLELADMNMGDVHYHKGMAYEVMKNSEEAAREYNLAFAAYKSGNVPSSDLCNASIKIGLFHMKQGKCKKSIDFFNVAARILSEKELVVKLAVVLCLKSKCLLTSDTSVSEAIEVCNECYDLCKSINDDPVIVEIYNELGLLFTQCKQFEKAGQCFATALEIHEDSSYETVSEKKAALLQNYGAILTTRGYFTSAVQHSHKAVDIYGSKGLRSSQCHCFLTIAFNYSQMKVSDALEKSEEFYLHAHQAAKDTGSAKDQWQSLEGLGGVAFTRRQASKAVKLYQKAIGLCATAGSTNEQDRLVKKLTAAVKLAASIDKAPLNGIDGVGSTASPLRTISRQSAGLGGNALLNETAQSSLPQMDMSYYRRANLEAKREVFTERGEDIAAVSEPSTRKRKRKRRRIMSRRSDREYNPIYGRPHTAVHHGLGTYQSQDDQTNANHLAPGMTGAGMRRQYHNGDDAGIISIGLEIHGLAVDDPSEPLVGTSKVRRDDIIDGDVQIRQVRPMSSKITHRPNSIMDGELVVEPEFKYAHEDREFSDVYDMCPDSDEDTDEDVVDEQEIERISDSDADDGLQANHDASEEMKLTTNDIYGSISPSSSKGFRPMNTFDKGKRPMSTKPILRKSSKVLQKRPNEFHIDKEHKPVLLETNDNFNEESDEERVHEEMKRFHNQSDFDSTTEYSEAESNPPSSKKPEVHFSDEESDTDSGDLASTQGAEAHETYEKPISPTAGGNFFKGHPSVRNQTYETVNPKESAVPISNAPPALPPRNYRNKGDEGGEFAETTTSGSEDIEEMTRGERDRYLYEKQKLNSEKIVKWEGRKVEQKTREKTKSQMCLVM